MSHKIFVHDRIIHQGGGEHVLRDLLDKFTEQKTTIFTLFSKENEFHGHKVITVFPDRLNCIFIESQNSKQRIVRFLFDYRNCIAFYPVLIWLLRYKIQHHCKQYKTKPTIVISSFAAVKNIVSPRRSSEMQEIILYLHSPMQYIWANYEEYTKKLHGFKGLLFKIITPFLRKRDSAPRTYSTIYVNSAYTAQCAKDIYGFKNVSILYPALDNSFIKTPALKKPFSYYLFIGRVVKYVRELDRIIDACNDLMVPLLIMGSGPDKEELLSRAGRTITFLGHISDIEEKITIIKQAKGMINITKESCGIGTMEALSLGVPVLGYNTGGTKELLFDPSMGKLVDSKEHHDLVSAWEQFDQTEFDRKKIKKTFVNYYHSVGSII